MRTVKNKSTLKEIKDEWVYVSSLDALFKRVGDEYIQKVYFSTAEVRSIIDMSKSRTLAILDKYNPQRKKQRPHKIRFHTLKQIIDERVNSQRT